MPILLGQGASDLEQDSQVMRQARMRAGSELFMLQYQPLEAE